MAEVYDSVGRVHWPPDGDGRFVLHPARKGNGVKPIKNGFVARLTELGWETELRMRLSTEQKPGPVDAVKALPSGGTFVAEWETGNVSSSHRALNKLALGLMEGVVRAGVLVVPSREMGRWITDRIGNFPEIEPYFPIYRDVTVKDGVLAVVEVEHDALSHDVPRIEKGTDGRALV